MELALSYPNDRWQCPVTGIVVAKDREGNLAQRAKLLERAEGDEEFQQYMLGLCAQSRLLWFNLFAWTFVTIEQTEDGRRGLDEGRDEPFATWVCQDALLARWQQAKANGETLLVPKSREMGASWIFIGDAVFESIFAKKFQTRVLSRKEDLVDGIDNPDTLLWKADYIVKFLPDWMRPVMYRRHLVRAFPDTGATIIGEATGDYSGAGGRGAVLLVDEAAQVDNLEAIDRTTRDTAGARAYITTSRQGTPYAKIRRSGRYPEFPLMWWNHPVKGAGRVIVTDPETGEKRYTSPWFEAEAANRDAKDIAENLMGEDSDSSAVVFSNRTIETQISRYGRDPTGRGFLELPAGSLIDPSAPGSTWPLDRVAWRDDGTRGPWRLWCTLVKIAGRLRPRQDHALVIGGDVGRGTGASNSDLAVWDAETGDKLARFTSSRVSPSQLADAIFIAGHWFGGRLGVPLVVIEANGAGTETLIRLRTLGYPLIYRHAEASTLGKKQSASLGWPSNRQRKRLELGLYRDALARHSMRNPDVHSLEEARSYVYYEDGGVGPLSLSTESEDARAAHGDSVIADMLARLGMTRLPPEPVRRPDAPLGSYARRMQELEDSTQDRDDE